MRAATAVIRTGTWRGKRIEARSAMMSNLGRRRAVMLLGCLMLALTVSIASAADPSGTWSVAAHLPQPRGETAMAALNGKLYVLGGYTPGNEASPLAEEYDPTSKAWRVLPPIPRTVSHPGVAALDGKLYVVGGFTANVHAGAIDSAFVYDPATNAWRALSPMTKPRGSVAVAALDGKLHALGGRGLDKVTVATHEVYDPETGKWSFVAPLPSHAIISRSWQPMVSFTPSAGAPTTTRQTIPLYTMCMIQQPIVGASRLRCRPPEARSRRPCLMV